MSNLVPLTHQPELLAHPDFVVAIDAAIVDYGHVIYFNTSKSPRGDYLSCWRSHDSLEYLWDQYLHHGGSSASNPDSGPLTHARGVGGDLTIWPTAMLKALTRSGIQVNGVPGEPWHIQLPNYRDYPIISSYTIPAGSGANPVSPTGKENEMANYVYINSGKDNANFAIGQRLVQSAETGVFRALADGEFALLEKTHPEIVWAEWSPAIASQYTNVLGLLEYVPTGKPGGVGRLTGKTIYPSL